MEENCKAKERDCKCYLDDNNKIIKFRYLKCTKNLEKDFNEDLKKLFSNTYKFCNFLISTNIFRCYENVFLHINTWMIREN